MEEEGEAQPSPYIVWHRHSLQGVLTLSKLPEQASPCPDAAVLFDWGRMCEIRSTYNFHCKVYTSAVFSACPSWCNEHLSGPRLYVSLLRTTAFMGRGTPLTLNTLEAGVEENP